MTQELLEQDEPNVKDKKNSKRKQKQVSGNENWNSFLETTQCNDGKEKLQNDDKIHTSDSTEDEIQKRVSNCVAIDCEMVGIGEDGKDNMLARVSIVNSLGKCLYDSFVKPTAAVADYRTPVSGVRASDLVHGDKFSVVQKKVIEILRGKILVGHAVHNDLIVLKIRHPREDIRDTSRFKDFCKIGYGTPSLKRLASHFLQVDIQSGEHNSIQDAQAAMQLYMLVRKKWEADVKHKRHLYLQQHYHVKKKSSKHSYKPKRFGRNYKR